MRKKDKKHDEELVVKHSHRDIGVSEEGCHSSPFNLPYSQTFRKTLTKILKQTVWGKEVDRFNSLYGSMKPNRDRHFPLPNVT